MTFTHRLVPLIVSALLLMPAYAPRASADATLTVNLLQAPDNYQDTSWTSFSLQTVATPNAAVSPAKANDATHLVVGRFIGQVLSGAIPGHTYVFSTWMKSATPSTQSVMLFSENNPPAPYTKQGSYAVTTQWQRFYLVAKCPDGGNSNFRFSYRAGDIYVWHPCVEDVTGSANPKPGDVPGVPAVSIPDGASLPAAVAASAGKNLLKASDDFGASIWTSFSSKTTITKDAALSPANTQDAAHIVSEAFVGQVLDFPIPGHTYVFSTWMKSATGADQQITLGGENNPPAPDSQFTAFTVTSTWQRFFIAFKCPDGGANNFRFSYRAGDFYAWHPQVEDVTGNAQQVPSDYAGTKHAAALGPLVVKGPPARGVVQNIACWGDSLTAGAGGRPYPSDLQATSAVGARTVSNGGVGGNKSWQILERFLAAPDKFGDLAIVWAGRNNFFDRDAVNFDIAQMVDKLTTDRFLVLSVLNMQTEPKGSGAHTAIVELNKDLATRYKGHYLDIRTALVEAYDKTSPQDVTDHDNDVTPSSLRSDKIHLNTQGYAFVAAHVLDFLIAKQWL